MGKRQNISSGAPWEDKVGYCRAVKVGNIIEVSGTVAVHDGKPVCIEDAYGQTKKCFEIIQQALMQADSRMEEVVRTRIYVTNIDLWEDVAKAHSEYFGHIKPATTMVEVSRLMNKEFLVEIEATAIVQ